MSREYLADKPTLDEVNEKIGDASGSSIFAKLNSIINAIADHVAIWTAAKAGNLDTAVSSRAPASTALSTAQWTNTRAGYLDKLNSGVAVSSLTGKIVKSIQRGTIAMAENEQEATVTISSVDTNKTIIIFGGSNLTSFSGNNDYYAPATLVSLKLISSTQVEVTRRSGTGTVTVPYQVIEFY